MLRDQWTHRPEHGESIAVNGCCLTLAAENPGGRMCFDVVRETLEKTTLARLSPGDDVNLEHACRPDTLLGGHIVQGHIDGVGVITRVRAEPADWRLEIAPGEDLMPYIIPKGSVTLEGVSLTIASVGAASFGVALIPTTLEKTTLGALREGSKVNIESDILAKTVVHALRRMNAPAKD